MAACQDWRGLVSTGSTSGRPASQARASHAHTATGTHGPRHHRHTIQVGASTAPAVRPRLPGVPPPPALRMSRRRRASVAPAAAPVPLPAAGFPPGDESDEAVFRDFIFGVAHRRGEDADRMDEDEEAEDWGGPPEDEEHAVAPRRRAPKRKAASHKKAASKRVRFDAAGGGAPSAWTCSICTFSNDASVLACSMCTSERPAVSSSAPGTWRCSQCTSTNPSASQRCELCDNTKDAAQEIHSDDDVDMTLDLTSPVAAAASSSAAAASSSSHHRRSTGEVALAQHPVFLAGLEEAFGYVQGSKGVSQLLRDKIAKFVKARWQLLEKKFADRDEKVMSLKTFQTLQKALVYDACTRVMQLGATMETIWRVMESDRLEMMQARCMVCYKSGSETELIHNDECFPAGQWKEKHWICVKDAAQHVMQLVNSKKADHVSCPSCGKDVNTVFIKACLSKDQFTHYSDVAFQISLEDSSLYQRCPNDKCAAMTEKLGLKGELTVPKGGITLTDDAGKVLSESAWRHYSEFRLRCPSCSTVYCTACRTIPYHLGKTCSEHTEYQSTAHCRYCTEQLEPGKIDATRKNGLLVCKEHACQQLAERACQHKLDCGHPCYGVLDEKEHPICLDEACAKEDSKYKGDDFCSICWTESLSAAPIVVLSSCRHAMHERCVIDKIRNGKPGTRHTFGFLDCPTCKARMDHPSAKIQEVLAPTLKVYADISAKAEARLKIEGMLADAKLITPGSRYFGNPKQYALDSFAYYNCYKCKRAYFGGRRDCEQNAAAEVRPDEEFVCYECADLKSVNCKFPTHSEFQLWKCRFCCAPAIWFCFGSTHFCDACHVRPNDVMKRPKGKTKQCRGAAHCPLGVAHAPNGPDADCEQNLGCGVCQETLTKQLEERKKAAAVDEAIEKAAAGGEDIAAAAAAAAGPPPEVKAPVRAASKGRKGRK